MLPFMYSQYWDGSGGGGPAPAVVTAGYPRWQVIVIWTNVLLFVLVS